MTRRKADCAPEEWAKIVAARRAYREANRDKVAAARRRHRATPKGREEKRLERQRIKEADPDAYSEMNKRWQDAHIQRQKALDPVAYALLRKGYDAKARARRRETAPETIQQWRRKAYYKEHPLSRTATRETMALARAALPPGLPVDIREDVVNSAFLAVLEGKIPRKDIGIAAKQAHAAHNRQFDHHKVLSLDANIPGMKSTWLDALPDDTERF